MPDYQLQFSGQESGRGGRFMAAESRYIPTLGLTSFSSSGSGAASSVLCGLAAHIVTLMSVTLFPAPTQRRLADPRSDSASSADPTWPGPAMNARRFTPPWSVEELEACFVVIDSGGRDFRSTGLTGYNDVPSKNRTRRACR